MRQADRQIPKTKAEPRQKGTMTCTIYWRTDP